MILGNMMGRGSYGGEAEAASVVTIRVTADSEDSAEAIPAAAGFERLVAQPLQRVDVTGSRWNDC